MIDPDAHYRLVYTSRSGDRHVSLARLRADTALHLARTFSAVAQRVGGVFTAEDERDVAAAA